MLFFQLFFIFIITENIYQSYIPGLNYFDEAITIISFLLLLFQKRFVLSDYIYLKKILFCIFFIVLIGTISTVYFQIQPRFEGIWRDCLAIVKFPICYCGLSYYMQRYNKELIQKQIVGFSKVYLVVLIVFAFYNLLHYTPWLSNGQRYGFPLFSFLYTHSTFLVMAVITMIAVLLSDGIKKNRIYIIFGLLILILTFRSKTFPVIIFIVLSYIWIKNKKKVIRHKNIKIVLGIFFVALIAIYFSMQRIEEYIGYGDTSARGAFYINGLDIALNYFPLGSGFCTFASSLSTEYYSPLYYKYGMNLILGLTIDDNSYAGDAFWPNIYAQYGLLGFATYLIMLYYFYKSISKRFTIFSNKWIAAIALLIYSVSAAFAESFYTNDSAVILAVILSVYFGENNKNKYAQ